MLGRRTFFLAHRGVLAVLRGPTANVGVGNSRVNPKIRANDVWRNLRLTRKSPTSPANGANRPLNQAGRH